MTNNLLLDDYGVASSMLEKEARMPVSFDICAAPYSGRNKSDGSLG